MKLAECASSARWLQAPTSTLKAIRRSPFFTFDTESRVLAHHEGTGKSVA